MAAEVSGTGPPSPMFSPADVQVTPAPVSRAPSGGSPGHWCESPQPAAISALCAAALLSSPELSECGGGRAGAGGWWIGASSWLATAGCRPGGVLAGGLVPGPVPELE